MNAAQSYICARCDAHTVTHNRILKPAGWVWLGSKLYCDDCAAVLHAILTDETQTHDSTSAINDEAAANHHIGAATDMVEIGRLHRRNMWQIDCVFHTDKGAVNCVLNIAADTAISAIELVKPMICMKAGDLVSIKAVPAEGGVAPAPMLAHGLHTR